MQIRRTKTTRRFHETNHTVNYCCITSEQAKRLPHIQHTAECPPHDVFNSWHIAQNKAPHQNSRKKSQHVRSHVMCAAVLTKLKRYAKYGIHKLACTSLSCLPYHITHIRHATVRCVPTCTQMCVCAQIITNMELLLFYSLNHKNLFFVSAFFFVSFWAVCNVWRLAATWVADFYLHSHGDLVEKFICNSLKDQRTNESTSKKMSLDNFSQAAVLCGVEVGHFMHICILLLLLPKNRKTQILF